MRITDRPVLNRSPLELVVVDNDRLSTAGILAYCYQAKHEFQSWVYLALFIKMASYSLEIFASFLAHGAHWPGVTRLKNEYKYVHERSNPSRLFGISI